MASDCVFTSNALFNTSTCVIILDGEMLHISYIIFFIMKSFIAFKIVLISLLFPAMKTKGNWK